MAQPALDFEAEFNKARQMITQGRLAEAEPVLTRLKSVMAPHSLIHEYLGFIAAQQQDLKKAIRHYRKAVKLDPGYADLKTKLAELLVQTGAEAEANKLALAVQRKEPENVTALNLLGYIAGNAGRDAEAKAFFQSAVQLDPQRFEAWHNFGRFLIGLGAFDEALSALNQANNLRADHRDTLTYMGRAFVSLGSTADAITVLKRAVALASTPTDYANTAIHLAEAFRRAEQRDDALQCLSALQAKQADFPQADALRATILHEQGQHEEALTIAQALKANKSTNDASWMPAFVEAQSLVSLGRHEEAAAAFADANRREKKLYASFGKDKELFTRYTAEATSLYDSMSTGEWSSGGGSNLCFINGFPRSGTTLIDAILRTHSQVAIAEEANAADACWQQAANIIPGGRAQIGAMNETAAEELRKLYWRELEPALSTERTHKTVIDRHATGLLQAGLMKRLFPEAKFFFMLRHPCDAVLSAWMRNYQPSHHTANYLTIQDTARTYDAMMKLYTVLEDRIGLNATRIRYEDLVTDLHSTVEPMLSAMGLTWEQQLEDFHQSQNRPSRTASFAQVSKPLYQSATYRFEHYQATLEPVMPVLEPWVKHFGYA
ncbi:MAG: sulfotransferase [Parvularculaceae bacterium]|nr:sulfotransferase [Parvularculaceae bacterium]